MFTIEFKGRINLYFEFEHTNYYAIYPKINDGKLLINGREICVNPSCFTYIQQKIVQEINSDKNIVDMEFFVENDGNCICTKSYHGSNQIDRFLSKWFG